MKKYYAQLHLHTAESSRCGHSTGREMAQACKDAGYSVLAVTDHFINANINCDPDAPWEEKVRILMSGYHAAKEEGDRIGLLVLPGWETCSPDPDPARPKAPELLTYGLEEAFLLANPDICDVSYYEYIRRVQAAGGIIIHAHPYRRASYIPVDFKPDPRSVEAYEVYNHGNDTEEMNELALREAREHHLLQFAGSDAHRTTEVGYGAMAFPCPVASVAEMFALARRGEAEIVRTMPGFGA